MNTNALTETLDKADGQGRFLSGEELESFRDEADARIDRIDIVKSITSNASAIVANAARSLFSEQPQLIAPGGNAYTSRRMATCLNDLQIILRYITYAMLAGDSGVLEERLTGLREIYLSLGTPPASVALAIQKMKDVSLELAAKKASSDLLKELASYFDQSVASIA